MTKGVYIIGTDTEVGKTYITALIIQALRGQGLDAGYFKAALSGDNQGVNDARYVLNACGLGEKAAECVPYIYQTPVSPHLAAKLEGVTPEIETIKATFRQVAASHDYLVAEGSGGIICPLSYDAGQKIMLTDIIKLTGFPVVIVAPCRVGTINAALLTASYAQNQGLEVAGFILNRYEPASLVHQDNAYMLENLSQLPIIARVQQGDGHISLSELWPGK